MQVCLWKDGFVFGNLLYSVIKALVLEPAAPLGVLSHEMHPFSVLCLK